MDNKIGIGDIYEYKFSFDQENVIQFAKATGDYNPIHLDEKYAQKTIFKKTIIHGFLGGSIFSKVFGTIFPGEGTIYLKQDMSFYKPMFTNQVYKAIFEVINTIPDKNRASVQTTIFDEKNSVIIKGEAMIQHPKIY